jgi:hypothetical protein
MSPRHRHEGRLALPQEEWPPWWEWDLELTIHAKERMSDRRFSEVDLRTMLETVQQLERGAEPGSWMAPTRFRGRSWMVVVAPDFQRRRMLVITAYPID